MATLPAWSSPIREFLGVDVDKVDVGDVDVDKVTWSSPTREFLGSANCYIWVVVILIWWIIEYWDSDERIYILPDMEFVKNFTQPDFQAKNFTPQKRVNCDIFLANQQRKCIKY